MMVSNKILVKKLKHDDHKAFEKLFSLYAPKVLNFGMKFLWKKEDAEEIVQIVFMAVWENRLQIDEEKSFLTYIFTIARNHIVNTLRKKVYLQGFINYSLDKKDGFGFVTEEQVMYNELSAILQRCIEELPPKRKEVFLLSRTNGMSYKEIAGKLDITESTVNTQITKSIENIKKRLEELF